VSNLNKIIIMKRILLALAVVGTMSLATSCQKCNTCTGSNIDELNHDYCNGIYRTAKTVEAAKVQCELRGGTWSEK